MSSKIEVYTGLLNLINKQEEVISEQNEVIAKLVNENSEKENMINILLEEA